MNVREMHDEPPSERKWLTPQEFAAVVPGASATAARTWCAAGKVPGAIQLPSGRWQIPWSAVVGILGFDPRSDEETVNAPAPDEDRGDQLPGLGGQ
jgi:hypothetical protein